MCNWCMAIATVWAVWCVVRMRGGEIEKPFYYYLTSSAYVLGFSGAIYHFWCWLQLLYLLWLTLEVRAPLNPGVMAYHRFKMTGGCFLSLRDISH